MAAVTVHPVSVFLFPSDISPGMDLLDHVVFLDLVFWWISERFSTGAAPIYILTNSIQVFLLSTSSSALIIYGLSDDNQSDRHKMISHCGFDLHFYDDNNVEHLVMSLVHTHVFFRKMSIQFCPFLNWVNLQKYNAKSMSNVTFSIFSSRILWFLVLYLGL